MLCDTVFMMNITITPVTNRAKSFNLPLEGWEVVWQRKQVMFDDRVGQWLFIRHEDAPERSRWVLVAGESGGFEVVL